MTHLAETPSRVGRVTLLDGSNFLPIDCLPRLAHPGPLGQGETIRACASVVARLKIGKGVLFSSYKRGDTEASEKWRLLIKSAPVFSSDPRTAGSLLKPTAIHS